MSNINSNINANIFNEFPVEVPIDIQPLVNGNAINSNIINGNAINSNIINGNAINGNVMNGNAMNSNAINGNVMNGNAMNGNTINGNINHGNLYSQSTNNGDNDEVYDLFDKAILDNDLEKMVELASFFSHDDVFVMERLIQRSTKDVVELFIGLGYNIPSHVNNSPVIKYAIQNNSANDLLTLLLERTNYGNNKLENNEMLLYISKITGDNLNLLEKFMQYNYDLNYQDEVGNTYFIWACAKGNLEIVKKLLDLGIDTNLTTKNKYTGADYAYINKYDNIIDFLAQKNIFFNANGTYIQDGSFDPDYLYNYITKYNIMLDDMVKLKIISMSQINTLTRHVIKTTSNICDKPILFVICDYYTRQLMELYEGETDIFDNYNNNVLHYLFGSNNNKRYAIYRYLLKKLNRFIMNQKNNDGYTPLHLLAMNYTNESITIIKHWIDNYKSIVNIMEKSNEGMTIVDYLICKDNLSHAEICLEKMDNTLEKYISELEKPILAKLIHKNNKIGDYILFSQHNVRDLLEINMNDYPINNLLEIGLMKGQICSDDILKYEDVINFSLLDNTKNLWKELVNNFNKIKNKNSIIKDIVLSKIHLFFVISKYDYLDIYHKGQGVPLLETILTASCLNKTGIINKVYSKDKLQKDILLLSESCINFIIDNELHSLIELVFSNGYPINECTAKKLINFDLTDFSGNMVANILKNIKDNKTILKLVLNDNKVLENTLLTSAIDKPIEENCIVCYSKENDMGYYYQCSHRHNYHYDCIIPYLKKHKMEDMKCFFCQGEMDFGKVLKH